MHFFRLATFFIPALPYILLLSALSSPAQRESTAYKTAGVSVFGGYLNLAPDVGPFRDNGFAAGIDYTRYFHFPLTPSVEVRSNVAKGTAVNEKSYLVGLRGEGTLLHIYHPYGDFLVGKGTIHYNQQYFGEGYILGDSSAVFSYGGGVNIEIAHDWQLKLDVQQQRWRPGVYTYYHPLGLLVGVDYRIPFKRLNDRHSLH